MGLEIILAVALTSVVVLVVGAMAWKTILSAANSVAAMASTFGAWATRPWDARPAVQSARQGWATARGVPPVTGGGAAPGAAPPAPATPTGTTSPAPVSAAGPTGATPAPVAPTPRQLQRAAGATARGSRIGQRIGWAAGTGAATTVAAVRRGPRAAAEAYRRSRRPATEPGGNAPEAPPEQGAAPGAEPPPTPPTAPTPTPQEATPQEPAPPTTEGDPVQEPRRLHAVKERNPMPNVIPGEIPDLQTLITTMTAVQQEIGVGDELNEDLAALGELTQDASTLVERISRDLGEDAMGAAAAFQEAAGLAHAAYEQLRAAFEAMHLAASSVSQESTATQGAA